MLFFFFSGIELYEFLVYYLSKFAQRSDGSLTQITEADLEGTTQIANYAFQGLKILRDVTVPDNVASIGVSAFYGCILLESIRFGVNSKLNAIGAEAFRWCWGLGSVYLPVTPPVLADSNAFTDIMYDCIFYCKSQASLDAYKAAPIWNELTSTYSFVVEA